MNSAQFARRVVCATSHDALAPHVPAWASLAREASAGEWWAGPDWVMPWLTAFKEHHAPAVCFVYEQEQLVGVVPFVRDHSGPHAHALTLPRNAHVRRIGWLSRIDAASMLTTVLQWHKHTTPLRALHLPQLPKSDQYTAPLTTAANATGYRILTIEEAPSAVVETPNGWQAYVDSRDGKLLRSLRRHVKRLDSADGWHMDVYTRADEVRHAWDALCSVETRSWKHAEGTSIVNEPGTAQLYEAVVRAFAARGQLRCWVLWQGDVPVAHALGVVEQNVFYLLKNSYDHNFRSLSPGMALVWHAMQDAVQAGVTQVDFLGDATDWKRPLATTIPAYASWTLYPAWHMRMQWRALLERVVKPPLRRWRARREQSDSPQPPEPRDAP